MLQTPTEYWGSIQFRRNNFENVDRVLRQNKRNFRKYVQYIFGLLQLKVGTKSLRSVFSH